MCTSSETSNTTVSIFSTLHFRRQIHTHGIYIFPFLFLALLTVPLFQRLDLSEQARVDLAPRRAGRGVAAARRLAPLFVLCAGLSLRGELREVALVLGDIAGELA